MTENLKSKLKGIAGAGIVGLAGLGLLGGCNSWVESAIRGEPRAGITHPFHEGGYNIYPNKVTFVTTGEEGKECQIKVNGEVLGDYSSEYCSGVQEIESQDGRNTIEISVRNRDGRSALTGIWYDVVDSFEKCREYVRHVCKKGDGEYITTN